MDTGRSGPFVIDCWCVDRTFFVSAFPTMANGPFVSWEYCLGKCLLTLLAGVLFRQMHVNFVSESTI